MPRSTTTVANPEFLAGGSSTLERGINPIFLLELKQNHEIHVENRLVRRGVLNPPMG